MKPALPYRFTASLTWAGAGAGHAGAGARPPMSVGPPPEFGGDDRAWSPEHLLLSALNGCLMATFAAVARAEGLVVNAYESRAHAVLDRTPDGVAFTHFRTEVYIECTSADQERVRAAMMRAKSRCLVANALRLPVEVEVNVAASHPAAGPAGISPCTCS